jgi:sensor histidine kinase YesM
MMDTNFTDTKSSIQCSLTKSIFAKNTRLEKRMALRISMKYLEEQLQHRYEHLEAIRNGEMDAREKLLYNMELKAKEKVEAELSFLKAQIKPHFLFNTLNSIYSLAIQKSNEVPQAIALFSVMLRYITNEAHKNFIPINKELGYISSYVGLQKLRFENTVNVEFYIEGSTDEREIAPLLLSTFVENAFKYGVNPEKKSVIKISVFVSESEICLTVFNNKVIDRKTQITEGGLGLENVKKRLDLLYPNLHELVINNDKESYSILLKIKLK